VKGIESDSSSKENTSGSLVEESGSRNRRGARVSDSTLHANGSVDVEEVETAVD
jgi:hypothetical protein